MIRPETVALLDRFLATERSVDDLLAQFRDLVCDLTEAGDHQYRSTDAIAKHAPKGFVLDVENAREDWAYVGGQKAIDKADELIRQLSDLIGERS